MSFKTDFSYILFDLLLRITSFPNTEPPSSMASLAFVFDVTGSMSTELDQVKSGAKKILKTISEHEEKIIYNYIFVPFGDPSKLASVFELPPLPLFLGEFFQRD